jgi:hypothetical protein
MMSIPAGAPERLLGIVRVLDESDPSGAIREGRRARDLSGMSA